MSVNHATENSAEPLLATLDDLERQLSQKGAPARVLSGVRDVRMATENFLKHFGPLKELVEQCGFEAQFAELQRDQLECGIIEQDVVGKKPGLVYVAPDGEEYRAAYPTYAESLDDLKNHPEIGLLVAKLHLLGAGGTHQPFRPTIDIEPVGASMEKLISALAAKTVECKEHLYPLGDDTAKKGSLVLKQPQEPVYCWEEWKNPSSHLISTRNETQSQHDRNKADPRNFFRIRIFDGVPVIPHQLPKNSMPDVTGSHEDQKTQKTDVSLTRHQLVGGRSVNGTVDLLKQNPAYALEECETLQGAVAQATVLMHRTGGGVLGDYASGKDCARLCGGSRASSGFVGSFIWVRGGGQFFLGGDGPGYAYPGGAVPSAVGVR